MKQSLWCVPLLLLVLSCSRGPAAQAEPLPSFVVVDGIRYEATLMDQRDSVQVRVRIINTRPDSARIALGGCPATLLAYVELPREDQRPTWSERWEVLCTDMKGAAQYLLERPRRSSIAFLIDSFTSIQCRSGLESTIWLSRSETGAPRRFVSMRVGPRSRWAGLRSRGPEPHAA